MKRVHMFDIKTTNAEDAFKQTFLTGADTAINIMLDLLRPPFVPENEATQEREKELKKNVLEAIENGVRIG